MAKLSHLDSRGRARMVDVGSKKATRRRAVAQACVSMNAAAFKAIRGNTLKKGDALSTAKIAGIQAAKRTADLIPLCHPLLFDHADVSFSFQVKKKQITVQSVVEGEAKTGFEMEAMTAASVAALALYDMAKAVDKAMVISDVCLLEKTGGKSGAFKRKK